MNHNRTLSYHLLHVEDDWYKQTCAYDDQTPQRHIIYCVHRDKCSDRAVERLTESSLEVKTPCVVWLRKRKAMNDGMHASTLTEALPDCCVVVIIVLLFPETKQFPPLCNTSAYNVALERYTTLHFIPVSLIHAEGRMFITRRATLVTFPLSVSSNLFRGRGGINIGACACTHRKFSQWSILLPFKTKW
jgi:hypothetical protein